MADDLIKIQNPYSAAEHERIPAKIWELLRRNKAFSAQVQQLSDLEETERKHREEDAEHFGPAWHAAWKLLEEEKGRNPFAAIALQWLLPEPVFYVHDVAYPANVDLKNLTLVATRIVKVGEGTTPDTADAKHWRWWENTSQANIAGHLRRRGPAIHWTISDIESLRSKVDPLKEWREYQWPFTLEHSWFDAPPGFRRAFHYLCRFTFDSRPSNQTNNYGFDALHPHETDFFRGWRLENLRGASNFTQEDLVRRLKFDTLADKYRVFAIPRTILTKADAIACGKWLTKTLKQGLGNEREFFGNALEWTDWLADRTTESPPSDKETHYYRRIKYMRSLCDLVYPEFNLTALLAPPKHRARGKAHIPKGGQK